MLIKFRGEKGNGSKSPIWKQMHRAGNGKERWGRVRSESKGLFDNFQLGMSCLPILSQVI